ncbi:ABC transporter substrate-binding protein [Falsirhodobacter sp. 20TX0035]|uniref:ABC transporter substrate-binding protein n=1 Tax=Falsirhodobacter sp. 20TX0035 TaxID=3022019 RepID=UPI00232D0DF7|nr:ABC transporter substrate-binding protein [Falsirhodobacter sp. 20TX0035]MDB6454061.1 ABC transporter substrate-binding protein [Falsirhodobacter sp. 20TX0035]
MTLDRIRLGYVPLTDAAPVLIAREMGFAAEEGLDLDLSRIGAWAQSRDLLGAGMIDAAHMLVPLPVAQAVGLGPDLPAMDLVMVLSQGGQAVAISQTIAGRMRVDGHPFDFADARAAGAALRRVVRGPLRVGVPFRFSTQAELMFHWLEGCGFAVPEIRVVTVPPPMMADAIAAGDVDAFCVGEPWCSFAVERGVATLLLPGRAIWAAPPEKGLVLRRDFTEARPDLTGRLMRAIWRAGRWLDEPENRGTAADILSRPEYLNLPPELAERGLRGRLMISAAGEVREDPDFIAFHRNGATFPWKSLAALFAARMIRDHGLPAAPAMQAAMDCFRTDLHREHLRPAGAALPDADIRTEGALPASRPVTAERGQVILRADAFFDGRIFDPPSST